MELHQLSRPTAPGLFITGTGTDIGKTVVSCLIADQMRRFAGPNERIGVIKPLASGCRKERGMLVSEDAEQLAHAADLDAAIGGLDLVTPIRMRPPLAPAMVLGKQSKDALDWTPVDLALKRFDETCEFVVAEGVGGVMVPLEIAAPDQKHATPPHTGRRQEHATPPPSGRGQGGGSSIDKHPKGKPSPQPSPTGRGSEDQQPSPRGRGRALKGVVTCLDMMKQLGWPVIVVADASLGTLNHTALTCTAIRSTGLKIAGVVLNRYDPRSEDESVRLNGEWIRTMCRVKIVGLIPESEKPWDVRTIDPVLRDAIDTCVYSKLCEVPRR